MPVWSETGPRCVVAEPRRPEVAVYTANRMKAARQAHAPRARSIVRGQSDTGMRQLDARIRTLENGLRRPVTRVRLPDMGVRRRLDVDTMTVAGLDVTSSLDVSPTPFALGVCCD
ncbi:hypothetical protein F0562_031130 [Nyssa sinensis]|uniref:Uncharacterized protein n=1 Tax=Nyssa sinensis TaxID=561372 RepID=A0A5J5AUB0_9ASTE|nr:hypothetical protein F0562_031130 [Nyssa sinensis]